MGTEFLQNNDNIIITQKKYIDGILYKFKRLDLKLITTPLDNYVKLSKYMCLETEPEKSEMKNIPNLQLIASFMCLSVTTRPDITQAVNLLSQFNNYPVKSHWLTAKRTLRYLQITRTLFHRDRSPLTDFVSANWASDVEDRKSFSDYIFKYAIGTIF